MVKKGKYPPLFSEREQRAIRRFLAVVEEQIANETEMAIPFLVPGLESYVDGKLRSSHQRRKYIQYLRSLVGTAYTRTRPRRRNAKAGE